MEFREDVGFPRASTLSKSSSSSHNGIALSQRPPQPATADRDPFHMSMTTFPVAAAGCHGASAYRECLRNHAASVGGHVVDGCCEFMPGDGDSYKCAACGCHRSFHRKDSEASVEPPPAHVVRQRLPLFLSQPLTSAAVPPFLHYPQYQRPFGANSLGCGGTSTESSSEEQMTAGGQTAFQPSPTAVSRKRFRTKFTPEQKEKMLGFADRVGWRLQRQDLAAIDEFCNDVGVRRQVFKVWMHNSKQAMRKQQLVHLQQQPHEQLELHNQPENYA